MKKVAGDTKAIRKRRCHLCGRKNAKHNGEQKPLCGYCFKPANLFR